MATTVRISETYDLKTTIDRIGLIGIHTPSDALLKKMYPGLMKNHKFVRFLKCDVVGACASVLPADPLQVGVTSGTVAPEDMFNPILMRAVTNESFDTLMARIYYGASLDNGGGSVTESNTTVNNDFSTYYALLAENGKYKKAMPQRGFAMKSLVPIFHTLVCSYGQLARPDTTQAFVDISESDTKEVGIPNVCEVNNLLSNGTFGYQDAIVMKGRSVRMPKIPLHYIAQVNVEGSAPQPITVPETFVCAIVTPPAKLHEFYYRLRVTWTIRFEKVISATEYMGFGDVNGIGSVGKLAYGTNYEYDSKKAEMDAQTDLVDANGVDVNLVMQS